MEPYFLPSDAVTQLVAKLPEGEVFAVVAGGSSGDFELLPSDFSGQIDLACPRPLSSPRSMLFPMREVVARYPSGGEMPEDRKPIAILGLRACDLRALEVLDKVLLEGDFREPFYAARRERTLLISVDCAQAAAECFCTMVDGQPHPQGDGQAMFDLNLSAVEGGFVVEVGSEKGKEAVVLAQGLLEEATAEQLAERDASRQRMVEAVQEQNQPFQTDKAMSDLVKDAGASEILRKSATVCSECGACTLVCPTCHCFLLYDQLTDGEEAERVRALDSCLYASYARMAGVGGMKPSPRPNLQNRFLNRLLHKFVWLPESAGLLGCVGCGRCIESDMGGLDLRQFIHQLEG